VPTGIRSDRKVPALQVRVPDRGRGGVRCGAAEQGHRQGGGHGAREEPHDAGPPGAPLLGAGQVCFRLQHPPRLPKLRVARVWSSWESCTQIIPLAVSRDWIPGGQGPFQLLLQTDHMFSGHPNPLSQCRRWVSHYRWTVLRDKCYPPPPPRPPLSSLISRGCPISWSDVISAPPPSQASSQVSSHLERLWPPPSTLHRQTGAQA